MDSLSEAIVRIDAVARSDSHDFNLGTVGNIQIPKDLSLPDTGHNKTDFYIRVVDGDTGRVIAIK